MTIRRVKGWKASKNYALFVDDQGSECACCDNQLVVQSLSDLPAPVAGVVELPEDTFLLICGDLDVGDNVLALPRTSVLGGLDPAASSVTSSGPMTVFLPEGGTLKDLAVRNTSPSGVTICVGEAGGTVPVCVLFNVAVGSADSVGVQLMGNVAAFTLSRFTCTTAEKAIQMGDGVSPTLIAAAALDQCVISHLGQPLTAIDIPATTAVESFSFSQSFVTGSLPTDVGLQIDSLNVATLRASSCAYFGPGTPSAIAQGGGLPSPATLGTAVQSESVGCVGFQNSLQRGSIQIVNALTTVGGGNVGVFLPIGQAVGPTYTLDPASVRVSLVGATAPDQQLQFDRVAPYSALVQCSLSVRVAVPGFTFTPRVISGQLYLNNNPVGAAFPGTTPDFTTAAPVSISFSNTVELEQGFQLQLRIANETDGADLDVVAAKITVA